MITLSDWTVFGYYTDPLKTTSGQMHCTWYVADDYGTLVEMPKHAWWLQ